MPLNAVLVEGDASDTIAVIQVIAARPGAVESIQCATTSQFSHHQSAYELDWLLVAVTTFINTTAVAGNASLTADDRADGDIAAVRVVFAAPRRRTISSMKVSPTVVQRDGYRLGGLLLCAFGGIMKSMDATAAPP